MSTKKSKFLQENFKAQERLPLEGKLSAVRLTDEVERDNMGAPHPSFAGANATFPSRGRL